MWFRNSGRKREKPCDYLAKLNVMTQRLQCVVLVQWCIRNKPSGCVYLSINSRTQDPRLTSIDVLILIRSLWFFIWRFYCLMNLLLFSASEITTSRVNNTFPDHGNALRFFSSLLFHLNYGHIVSWLRIFCQRFQVFFLFTRRSKFTSMPSLCQAGDGSAMYSSFKMT